MRSDSGGAVLEIPVKACIEMGRRCASFRLRKIERTVTRHYESHLAVTGLTAMQFTALACIGANGEIRSNELATLLELDRSTLSRNLSLLHANGLVRLRRQGGPRPSIISLTETGRQRLLVGIEAWKRAHTALAELFPSESVEEALDSLADLATAIRSATR